MKLTVPRVMRDAEVHSGHVREIEGYDSRLPVRIRYRQAATGRTHDPELNLIYMFESRFETGRFSVLFSRKQVCNGAFSCEIEHFHFSLAGIKARLRVTNKCPRRFMFIFPS
jgi:hypothetical protein